MILPRKVKRIHYGRIIATLAIVIVACTGGFKSGLFLAEKLFVQAESIFNQIEIAVDHWRDKPSEEILPKVAEQIVNENFDQTQLHSQYVLLMDLENSASLLTINSKNRIYPASMTKMMTTIVAIESINDWDTPVTVSAEIIDEMQKASASMAGFPAGEKVSVKDLLYGVMLPSGGDAAMALAEATAGSQEIFVALMNQKAERLGMTNTHFTNVVGLHNDNHYTTAEDLAKLMIYALKNDLFRQIFTAKDYTTTPSNRHSQGITLHSSVLNKTEINFDGGCILGSKSGYTKEAGLCLASLAEKNGRQYILITAKAQGDYSSQSYHLEDALLIYEQYLK